jgi:integrase/recombinase XerD
VDCSVFGHESIKTTQVYPHAHLALKEAAPAWVTPFDGPKSGRYKPAGRLLAFPDVL